MNGEKMTIARALKEKERIAKRFTKARDRFAATNCIREGEEREVEANVAYESMRDLHKRYVAIKMAIAAANAGISPKLAEMLSLRAEIAFYTNLVCKKSEMADEWITNKNGEQRCQRVKVAFDTFIDENARQEILEKLTCRLDNLQDEVDNFNATHFVEFVA